MSADSILRPRTGATVAAHTPGNERHAAGAVDVLEITARLEASGLSDRTALSRHGATDVFEYAQSLALVQESAPVARTTGSWFVAPAVLDAVRRAIVLVLGAVLGGLTASFLDVGPGEVLVAGVAAWVTGQTVAGIVWSHYGAGHLARGVAHGTGAALLVVAALGSIALVSLGVRGDGTHWGVLVLAWSWYSCVVSVLVILGRSWYLLVVLASAVSVATLALVLGYGSAAGTVLTVAALALVAVTAALAREVGSFRALRLPRRRDWTVAGSPALQAAFLAAALLMALTRLPAGQGTALIAATVIAAAATDPALVLIRQRLVWSSRQTPLLRYAARNAWLLTLAMSAAIVVLSASVSALVVVVLVQDVEYVTTAVITAAAFSALATTSTTLNAFGLSRASVVFAGGAAVSAGAWLLFGGAAGEILAVVFLVLGIVLLLRRVSDPRAYA